MHSHHHHHQAPASDAPCTGPAGKGGRHGGTGREGTGGKADPREEGLPNQSK